MTRSWLVVVLAAAVMAAGCVGSDDDGEALEGASEDANATEERDGGDDEAPAPDEGSAENGTETEAEARGPAPINRTHEDAGTAGVVLYDPGQSLGAKTTFAKRSYDNGFNGTWVLGYEVEPKAGHSKLTVETTADFADPLEATPEYDLFLYGPSGEVVAMSFESGSDEAVTVTDLEQGTYLAILYYQQGAQDPITTNIQVT